MCDQFQLGDDCKLLRELKSLSQSDLSDILGVGIATVNRWENGQNEPAPDNFEKFYSYADRSLIRLNKIKEQFYREELSKEDVLLFHGAKTMISGNIKTDGSRSNNDFGKGFYSGETFRQAALFVANFPAPSVYILKFDPSGLKQASYAADTDWMLCIAAFRGRLKRRVSGQKMKQICSKALEADYIIAPIADHRMYQIMDRFIDGEITDEQCRHALAATGLGMQYVFKTEKAVKQIKILERCYLCIPEKVDYLKERNREVINSEDKVRSAMILYRGKGQYIDQLL